MNATIVGPRSCFETKVSGDGRGCNTLSGKFIVHDITWSGSTLVSFTASFEQHCEQGSAALRGCVHYENDLGLGGASGE